MFWLLLFLLMLLAVVFFIFFAAFYLEANTTTGLLGIRFQRIASMRLLISSGYPVLEIRALWWRKRIAAISLFQAKKKTDDIKKHPAKRHPAKHVAYKKIKALLGSFTVNKCYVNVDSGDVLRNAMLYPLLRWLSLRTGRNMSINFRGEEEIIIEIENSVARMMWAYITT
jgi:hypothetical protein